MVYHSKKNINIRFYLLSKIQTYRLKKFILFWSFLNKSDVLMRIKNKNKFFTVVKSPFVFKKSKQHFYIAFYLLEFKIKTSSFNSVYKALAYVLNKIDFLFLKFKVFNKI
jgi:hypothetical protein